MSGAAWRRVRVTGVEDVAADTRAYTLEPVDGRPLPAYEAGAHVDVHTPSGQVRQYSLCTDAPDGRAYRIAVKLERAGQGGSSSMHEGLEPGSVIGLCEPRNHFPLVEGACHHVFVAGGIGITPIYAMIHAVEARGGSWELHYCARSREQAAFYEALHERFPDRVTPYFSETPLMRPAEVIGRLDQASSSGAGAHLYCCGPAGLMQAVKDAAGDAHAPRVHFEWFSAPAVEHAGDVAFEVELASSGTVLPVPAGTSILDVLHEHGVDVPCSCMEGVCGTCETRVVSGAVDHRDLLLSEQERSANRSMMVCVSRSPVPGGRIVLDL
jgi:vanillate O-demethylase ferredoxin subunit